MSLIMHNVRFTVKLKPWAKPALIVLALVEKALPKKIANWMFLKCAEIYMFEDTNPSRLVRLF